MIAVRRAVGAGEVANAVGEVGLGIAQAFGGAGVAEPARGRELDLHQADGAAAADQVGVVLALADDDAMHQGLGNAIGRGLAGNDPVIGAVWGAGLRRCRPCDGRCRGEGEADDGDRLGQSHNGSKCLANASGEASPPGSAQDVSAIRGDGGAT